VNPNFPDRGEEDQSDEGKNDPDNDLCCELKWRCIPFLIVRVKAHAPTQQPAPVALPENRFAFGIGWHSRTSNKLRHQIVLVRFGDLAAMELALANVLAIAKVVDVDRAVDFGRVHLGAAFPEQIGFS